MKFLHDDFVLCVSISLFVIITAEDHVKGVSPLGMLRLDNAGCSKFPASKTKCKRGTATADIDKFWRSALPGPGCAPRGAEIWVIFTLAGLNYLTPFHIF